MVLGCNFASCYSGVIVFTPFADTCTLSVPIFSKTVRSHLKTRKIDIFDNYVTGTS